MAYLADQVNEIYTITNSINNILYGSAGINGAYGMAGDPGEPVCLLQGNCRCIALHKYIYGRTSLHWW